MRAQFEEKQYEYAFNRELEGGIPPFGLVLPSGQVLEAIVGYDTAANPDPVNTVWRILRVPSPGGLIVQPNTWRPGSQPRTVQLPASPVSLFLQFKRPDWVDNPKAPQWHLWTQPYFRFSIDPKQQSTLVRLERRVRGHALVRYAAPAYWMSADLYRHNENRETIKNSGFLSPGRMRNHLVWTYQTPGTRGKRNPDGDELDFESVWQVGQLLELRQTTGGEGDHPSTRLGGEVAVSPVPLIRHVFELAALIDEQYPFGRPLRSLTVEWRSRLAMALPDQREDTLDAVAAAAAIMAFSKRARCQWLVLDRA